MRYESIPLFQKSYSGRVNANEREKESLQK